jgi:anti-sigma B factor antagonist
MGPDAIFTARLEKRNGVARVAMSGELDISTVTDLTEQLARVEQDGVTSIMLDLRDLAFIDSSGLHAFLQARDRASTNGHRLILVGAGALPRRLFEITGTEFLLDEHEAISALDQFTGSSADDSAESELARQQAHV